MPNPSDRRPRRHRRHRRSLEDLFGLEAQVAVVVGATGELGAEAARALAGAGAHVGLVARRVDRLEVLASELEAIGAKVCLAPADITERAECENALALIESQLGPIDVLINSAGISPLGRAERQTREKWDRTVSVNLTAAFDLSQIVGMRWIESGSRGGRIIHVSSVLGRAASPVHHVVGYTATKAGLDNMVRQLAVEWAKYEIRVNAIAPGYFPSEMTTDPETGEFPPDHLKGLEARTPMNRVGRPGELETAVLFLAAPASSYITGVILPVDGGWTAW
jgi:NAD(P)-dependent dehydrogenase (short-subunit alcohol dehydrogenase family)